MMNKMKIPSYYNVNISLLDKLIGDQALFSTEKNNLPNVDTLRSSIRRDLENLLNTRRSLLTWPKEWQELDRSLFAYGVPDITGRILDTPELQNQFCRNIRHAIECFETRLKNVSVSIIHSSVAENGVLRLRIEGLMLVEPDNEFVVFNSRLEHEVGVFSLEESNEEYELI